MRKCCGDPGTLSVPRRGGGKGGEAETYLQCTNKSRRLVDDDFKQLPIRNDEVTFDLTWERLQQTSPVAN